MKIKGDVRIVGFSALLVLLSVMLFNNTQVLFSAKNLPTQVETGYFLSQANHLCGLFSDQDHSCPADNEEDEDEDENDNEKEFHSSISESIQELNSAISFAFYQDRLFCDPLAELISPPPKI